MGINIATLSGHVGQEPEIRFTPNGHSVCTFSIAVQTYQKGEKATLWMTCKAWNKVGELCANLQKGNLATVSGNLEEETWLNQSGEKRSKITLNVRDIQLPPKQE